MTTWTMGRIMLGIGLLATLALLGSVVVGYRLEGTDPGFQRHALWALGGMILALVSHLWFGFFWLGSHWALRRTLDEAAAEDSKAAGREGGVEGFPTELRTALEDVRINARRLAPWSLLMALFWVGSFLYGAWVFAEGARPLLHHGLAYALLVAQLDWLRRSARRLRRGESALDSLESYLR